VEGENGREGGDTGESKKNVRKICNEREMVTTRVRWGDKGSVLE